MAVVGALSGALLLGWALPAGPGLSPDSLKYLLLAQSLGRGQGYRFLDAPMTHFPPAYPALLASAELFGWDLLGWARLLQAALLALNGTLLALAAERGGHRWAAPLAVLLLLGSPGLFTVHAMAWSEALFLALALGSLLLLIHRLDGGGTACLLGAGACLGLALLTRYAALAFLPAGVLACTLAAAPARPRWRDGGLLATLASAPLLVWAVGNLVAGVPPTDRPFAFHPAGLGHAQQALAAVAGLWGLGARPAGMALAAALSLTAVGVGVRALRCTAMAGRARLSAATALAGACYASLLFASLTFADADTPLDVRLLAPLHVLGLLLLAPLPFRLLARGHGRAGAVSGLLLATVAIAGVVTNLREAARLRDEGEGFGTRKWRLSPVLRAVRSLPADTVVFSNGPEIVQFLAGHVVRDLPAWANRVSLRRRPQVDAEVAAVCKAVARGALVVELSGVTWRWEVPGEEELRDRCQLSPRARLADGTIYEAGVAHPAVAGTSPVAPGVEVSRAGAVHVATEGPLGLWVRQWIGRRGLRFTTSFHTRFERGPQRSHAHGMTAARP